MKDVKGTELKIGDYVVFVQGKNDSARLATGHITKFYQGQMNKEECSVDTGCGVQSHVRSFRVMKLEESNDVKAADTINNNAISLSCNCPKCGKVIKRGFVESFHKRGFVESFQYCPNCGTHLHLPALSQN